MTADQYLMAWLSVPVPESVRLLWVEYGWALVFGGIIAGAVVRLIRTAIFTFTEG